MSLETKQHQKLSLSKLDTKYILAFVEEINVLYEGDDGTVFPWQIEDMMANIREILRHEPE